MIRLKPIAITLTLSGCTFAAHAELKPLGDQAMGSITGQAGVTIELETQLNIGQVRYTDEGSLAVNDIFIGGANRNDMFPELGFAIPNTASDSLDNIKINIDLADDGDAVVQVLPIYGSPVDFAIRTGQWNLEANDGSGDSTTLMDNLSVEGIFGSLTATVDTATDKLNLDTRFAIDDLDVDIPFAAIGIRDMQITGAGYDDNPNVVSVFTHANLDIYKAPNAAGVDSLAVDVNQFDADMHIGSLLVGGTSIGSIGLDNLSIRNTQMRIYGH